jgi:signal transduction histidine kinase
VKDLPNPRRWYEKDLLRWLVGVTAGLTIFTIALRVFYGPGQVIIVLFYFTPVVYSFIGLAALSIVFLCFGRYRVLRQPAPYWVGMAFGAFTVIGFFYVAVWLNMVPGGPLANAASWLFHLQLSVLVIFLIVAVYATWPKASSRGERWWLWTMLAGIVITTAISSSLVAFDQYLPDLVVGVVFTSLANIWNWILEAALLAHAFVAALYYRQRGDTIIGYSAFVGVLVAFMLFSFQLGSGFYTLWWYWAQVLLTGGVIVMMFGLLSEYVELYRREREKTLMLETADQLRDEFISAAAHELKTTTTTIKGYVQILKKWAPEKRDPTEMLAIEAINTQANRISRRVDEMIKAVRVRKSPAPLNKTRFDLGELAADVVRRMQTLTVNHQLSVEQEGGVEVTADRDLIDEVLTSMLDNAIKFSPGGGTIKIRVWKTETEALVSVQDFGIGIAKQRQLYVFAPFYELVPSGVLGYTGTTALGLYLSRLTIERHQGRIWLESEEGKGSTFYFALPLNDGGSNVSPG